MIRYYRNLKELTSIEGTLVDEGALWFHEGDKMVLVDDDQYVSTETHLHDARFVAD